MQFCDSLHILYKFIYSHKVDILNILKIGMTNKIYEVNIKITFFFWHYTDKFKQYGVWWYMLCTYWHDRFFRPKLIKICFTCKQQFMINFFFYNNLKLHIVDSFNCVSLYLYWQHIIICNYIQDLPSTFNVNK